MANILQKSYYNTLKHRRLGNKKSLSSEDYETIKTELKNWLVGIEEDDPLPFEISVLCFCFDFDNKNVSLQVSGHENMPTKIFNGSYFPLEAQYFFCELLNSYFNNQKNLNKKGEIFEYKKEEIFSKFENFLKSFQRENEFFYLDKKKIIIGENGKEKSRGFIFNIYNNKKN